MLTTTALATVAHWFKDRRGLAQGIAMAGSSFGGVINPLILRATLPKSMAAESLTLAQAIELIEAKRAAGGGKKPARKTAARKPAAKAADSADAAPKAKKPAARKTAAKPAAGKAAAKPAARKTKAS